MHPTDLRALLIADAHHHDHQTHPTRGAMSGALGLNSAPVTALLDRLAKAGHLPRERDTTPTAAACWSSTPTRAGRWSPSAPRARLALRVHHQGEQDTGDLVSHRSGARRRRRLTAQ
ncbi:hypothetical protein [Actinokineospora cianjurensis]|uniref:hypothetical protein n=1 Tax=Actinokineospora cianjurensis TaxID=585224 RepID=UPI0011C39B9B|nr:hypothetical protein [Actinokineospora cianjurensis]